MTVQTKKKTVLDTLDRLEQSKYSPYTIGWVCDSVAWLYKWGHITAAECNALCDRAIALLEYERSLARLNDGR